MFDPIQTGNVIRKFSGMRFMSSGSYMSKESATRRAKFARSHSGRARVVKYKKGFVVFENWDATKGRLVKKKK